MLFLFNSPAQRVASTLSGVARNLAYVISQAVKEKKFQETAQQLTAGSSQLKRVHVCGLLAVSYQLHLKRRI